MKKAFLAAAIVATMSGCFLSHSTIPRAPIQFARSEYSLLGETNEKQCGFYIGGINFVSLFHQKGASSKAVDFFSTVEEQGALFSALEKVPTATHLIDPRVSTSITGLAPYGFPLIAQVCAEVKAVAVKVGGPNPQQ